MYLSWSGEMLLSGKGPSRKDYTEGRNFRGTRTRFRSQFLSLLQPSKSGSVLGGAKGADWAERKKNQRTRSKALVAALIRAPETGVATSQGHEMPRETRRKGPERKTT